MEIVVHADIKGRGQQVVGSLYIYADRTAVALYMYDSPAWLSPLPTPLKTTVLTTSQTERKY
jgi:hypothetical protein